MRIDFSEDINFTGDKPLSCELNGEEIIFIDYEDYVGPCTKQYLPNGGIVSILGGEIIIKVLNGYLGVMKLKFRGRTYTSGKFIRKYKDIPLINQILI